MTNSAQAEEKAQKKAQKERVRASLRRSRRLDFQKLLHEPFTITAILLLFAFLFPFVLYPLLYVFVKAFQYPQYIGMLDGIRQYTTGWTLANFPYIFGNLAFGEAMKNSVIIGLVVALGSVLIGFLFAYVEVYVRFKSKFVPGIFKIVSILPTISPPFLVAIAIILLFGNSGIITQFLFGKAYVNGWLFGMSGVIIVEIITFFPTSYLMLRGLLKNIDPSLEEAARDMGASRWKVFWTVTFPLILPGLGNAFLIGFIESIADFANPFIIGGSLDTMSTLIYNTYMGGNGRYSAYYAAAMALMLLVISMALYFVQKYGLERKTYATLSGKATRARIAIKDSSVRVPLGILGGAASLFVISLYLLVFLCSFWKNLDTGNLVFTLDNWAVVGKTMFGTKSSGLWNTIWTSLLAAFVTAALSMVVSFLVVKKKFVGRGGLEFLAMLAMAVPGTVLGIGYATGFVQGVFGSGFLSFLYGTMGMIVLIFIVRSLPIGIRSGVGALRQIDKSIEESASDMGAGSGRVFLTVTVPLIKDSLFSSLVTSFVRSMTAISAIIVVSTSGTILVTYQMNELAGKAAYTQAAVYATVLVVIAGATVLLMNLGLKFFGTSRVRKVKKSAD